MGLEVLIPALIPVLTDGFRMIFRRFFGGGVPAEPINVDERVKLLAAETEKLRVIAALDAPYGNISWWVADLRASSRYVLAGFILFCTMTTMLVNGFGYATVPDEFIRLLLDLSASVFAFLFGDRMYYHLTQREGRR